MPLRLLSVLGFLLMAGGLVCLILTHTLFSPRLAVVIPQVVAVLLMVWARAAFGRRSFHLGATPTRGGLVTTGPYRWIRHPIYTAVCLFVWPGALVSFSVLGFSLALLVTAGSVARILCEERLLIEQYPEYSDYARRTSRMIPFVF